jgi:hypothetical protein
MKLKIAFSLLFVTTILSAQVWHKGETTDNWGNADGYQYFQATTCIGSGSSYREETWAFGITYDPKERIITIMIYANQPLQTTPIILILDEQVTISLREGNSTQTFRGITMAAISTTKVLAISYLEEERLIRALQSNGNFTILIEGRGGTWYVRANIQGNMPRQ